MHLLYAPPRLLSSHRPIPDSSFSRASGAIQAQARCHRIGQTRPVTVYRLLSPKTYEMIMFERSSKRLGLVRPSTLPTPHPPPSRLFPTMNHSRIVSCFLGGFRVAAPRGLGEAGARRRAGGPRQARQRRGRVAAQTGRLPDLHGTPCHMPMPYAVTPCDMPRKTRSSRCSDKAYWICDLP